MGTLRRGRRPLAIACALVTAAGLAACKGDDPTFTDAGLIDADQTDASSVGRPGPVTDLAAASVATGLDLSWTNPGDADLAGVLVVAGAGVPVTFAPADGTSYTVGTVVGSGQAVIHASLATALAGFPGIAGVGFEFAAWAYDTEGLYSQVATTTGLTNLLGAQTGVIQLFQDGRVVVTQQPRSLRLSGTVVYSDAADTMPLQLAVENQTGRVLFNLKGLVDTASQGAVTNPSFPAAGGRPMGYFGPEAIAIGAAPVRQYDLTGIDGTVDPVVLTMTFVDAPMIVMSARNGAIRVFDSAGSGGEATVEMPGQSCGRAESRGGTVSASGRYVFTGAKSHARVTRIDLTTMALSSVELTTSDDIASVSDVTTSIDGSRLYAVLSDGTHANGGSGGECGGLAVAAPRSHRGIAHGAPQNTTYLVELDAAALTETRRLQLDTGGRLSAVEVLAGNRAVVATRDGLAHVVDLATWAVIDTDAGSPGVQPLDLAGRLHEKILVDPGRTRFTVTTTLDSEEGLDAVTFDAATLTPTARRVSSDYVRRVVGLRHDAAGRLHVLHRVESKGPWGADLVTFDGAVRTAASPLDEGRAQGFIPTADGARYFIAMDYELRLYDAATHAQLDVDGDAGNGLTPIYSYELIRDHGLGLLTPF